MTIKLKIIIKLLVLSGCFLLSSCHKEITFFVAGHTYGSPLNEELGIYPPFKAQHSLINNSKADFIALTGDMVKKPTIAHWNAFNNDLKDLNIPIIKAPGNHDMGNRLLYKQVNGNTDSLFSIYGNQFIALDNTKNGWGLDSMQINLIKKAIKNVKKDKSIFIFCHNVMWYKTDSCFTPNSLAGIAPEPYFNFWNTVEPLLRKSDRTIYLFAGDVGAHGLSKNIGYKKENNIHYITSGMGSGVFDNFLKVSVTNSVKIDVIQLNSKNTSSDIKNFGCY